MNCRSRTRSGGAPEPAPLVGITSKKTPSTAERGQNKAKTPAAGAVIAAADEAAIEVVMPSATSAGAKLAADAGSADVALAAAVEAVAAPVESAAEVAASATAIDADKAKTVVISDNAVARRASWSTRRPRAARPSKKGEAASKKDAAAARRKRLRPRRRRRPPRRMRRRKRKTQTRAGPTRRRPRRRRLR